MRFHSMFHSALSMALLAAAPVVAPAQPGGPMKQSLVAKVPDPGKDFEYGSVAQDSYSNRYGSCEYFAPSAVRWDPRSAPIVLLRHGNGFSHTEYSFLLEHLAKNGFIAGSATGTDADLLGHVSTLKGLFSSQPNVPVGLLGHSVGGDVILKSALLNEAQGKPHNLQALLGLAPAPHTDVELPATACDSYFLIYGSQDQDVTGWENAGPPQPGKEPSCAFESYDLAGTEANMDSLIIWPHNPPMRKSMLFVHGADHSRFSEGTGILCPTKAYISKDAHHDILLGYATAYFLLELQGELFFEAMLTGDYVPPTIANLDTDAASGWGEAPGQPVRMFTQYSAKRRRVVANFEQPDPFGFYGQVFASVDEAGDHSYHSPHSTRTLRARWTPTDHWKMLWWEVPDAFDSFTGTKRNVSDFEALSFRAGQVYIPAGGILTNPYLQDQEFWVWLVDEDSNVRAAQVSQFGSVPFPARHIYPDNMGFQCKSGGDYSKTAMNTVRIPLSHFGEGVDLTKIEFVVFLFVPMTTGEILLDNIEFGG